MPRTNKEKIISALLLCNTHKEAAALAGISETTLYKNLKDPAFSAAYEAEKQKLIVNAADQIQRGLEPAITALRSIAEDPRAGKTARVQAARSLLEYGLRLTEYTTLEARVKALEAAQAGGGTDNDIQPI